MGELAQEPTPEELLARAEWPYGLGPYEALGQRFRILTTDGPLARFLAELFAPMELTDLHRSTEGSGDEPATAVYRLIPPQANQVGVVERDGEILGSSRRRHEILRLLQWGINRQVIERACSARVILHAGAVDFDGKGVVIAGLMEAGKTTLTTGLLERGFRYLTDEAVAVDADLMLEGYAKPLSIDPGSWRVLSHLKPATDEALGGYHDRQWQVAAQHVAPVVPASRLAAIVVTRYVEDVPVDVERVSPSDALATLAHCTFVPEHSVMPVSRVRELADLVAAVPVFRLTSGDLEESCAAVSWVLETAVAGSLATSNRGSAG